MAAFVSLFRGINVGGHRQVKMDELKAMHEALGLRDVAPYIQSGSVVFSCDETNGVQLQQRIEDGFERQFGFHVEVLVRNAAELRAIIERNPFQGQEDKALKWIVVLFLAAQPDEAAQEALRKAYNGPEEYYFIGNEMYIYYPEGMGRSKLTNTLIERKLKTVGTARNWNTVLKLYELVQR